MHDYILIQSTQLFCNAVASYPSRGFWVSRYPPLLHCHYSPLTHPRHCTKMVTRIKTLDRDGSLRTQKNAALRLRDASPLGMHYPSSHIRWQRSGGTFLSHAQDSLMQTKIKSKHKNTTLTVITSHTKQFQVQGPVTHHYRYISSATSLLSSLTSRQWVRSNNPTPRFIKRVLNSRLALLSFVKKPRAAFE